MNKAVLFIIALLLGAGNLFGQVLPEVGAFWFYSNHSLSFPARKYFSIASDTTIANASYKVLAAFEVNEDELDEVGNLIEDSKIYLKESDGEVQFLENGILYTLVDFNAEIGDTVLLSTPSNYNFYNVTCCGFDGYNNYDIAAVVVGKDLIVEEGLSFQKMDIQLADSDWAPLSFSFTEKLRLPSFFINGICCLGGFDGGVICYEDSNIHFGPPDCKFIDFTDTVLEEHRWNIQKWVGFSSAIAYSLKIGEEEVIDGQTYRTVLRTEDENLMSWEPTGFHLRQQGKQVFLKRTDEPELLLYDYSLGIGDTISYPIEEICPLVVVDIDLVQLVNGQYRVRRFLEGTQNPGGYYQQTWIEGVGSLLGPLSLPGILACSDVTDTSEDRLLCFFKNDVLSFANGNEECWGYTGIVDLSGQIELYPNPFVNSINVNSQDVNLQGFALYDISGRNVAQGKLDLDFNKIDLNHLDVGTYLLQLEDSDGQKEVFKLIKL